MKVQTERNKIRPASDDIHGLRQRLGTEVDCMNLRAVKMAAEVSSQRRVRSNPMRRMQPQEQQMDDQEQLLKLAAWYREFADRAGNPMIWECRLQMAEDLEVEACRFTRCERCTAAPGLCPTVQE
jgi:hypothetical protein